MQKIIMPESLVLREQTRSWAITSDSIRERDHMNDVFSYCKDVVYDEQKAGFVIAGKQ